ncbi:MAG TPA: zinc ribbon domain-containing protein, partial [Kofleriaceae bacterium]|nr:zinc ribbon domain-containing protein [Kofleriaceae bacterium]
MCGHDSPPAAFCLHCGSSMAAPVAGTAPVPQGLPKPTPVAPNAICAVCRADNPPGMKFCRHCGSAVAGPPVTVAPEPPTLMPNVPLPSQPVASQPVSAAMAHAQAAAPPVWGAPTPS